MSEAVEKGMDELVQSLMNKLFSTSALKEVSDTLEEMAQDKRFKSHANSIVSDSTLTDNQKVRQLSYVLKTIVENPTLFDFFTDEIGNKALWLFASERIDYFDNFVQAFQLATEKLGILYLVTAIKLEASDLEKIASDLSKSFGYKVIIKHEVNPAIIGGAQVRVENLIFDFSLRTKFQQFQRQWISSLNSTNKLIGRHEAD